jgi:hypothetical protein
MKDEVILYDPDQRAVHILNPTAQTVWEKCDGAHGIEEIEQAIREVYAMPEGYSVKEDILQILNTFMAKQIILP